MTPFGRGIDKGKPGVYICREREAETSFLSVSVPNKLTASGKAIGQGSGGQISSTLNRDLIIEFVLKVIFGYLR